MAPRWLRFPGRGQCGREGKLLLHQKVALRGAPPCREKSGESRGLAPVIRPIPEAGLLQGSLALSPDPLWRARFGHSSVSILWGQAVPTHSSSLKQKMNFSGTKGRPAGEA